MRGDERLSVMLRGVTRCCKVLRDVARCEMFRDVARCEVLRGVC
mgnify:CR=1 FL=1